MAEAVRPIAPLGAKRGTRRHLFAANAVIVMTLSAMWVWNNARSWSTSRRRTLELGEGAHTLQQWAEQADEAGPQAAEERLGAVGVDLGEKAARLVALKIAAILKKV